MTALDTAVLVAYFCLVLGAVVYVRRARSIGDFALGKRRFSGTIVFATLAATCIGPGYSIGLSGKVSQGGYIWLLIFGFFALQMILTGTLVAPRLRAVEGAYTLGDVLGRRYGRATKLVAGVVALLFCAGVAGAIARATGSLASGVFGLDATTAIVVSMVIVTAYSAVGGIKAVVLTDVMQFIILALTVPLILFFELPAETPEALRGFAEFNPSAMSPMMVFGLAVSFMFGEFLLPPYSQRALIARDKSAARSGFVFVGLFGIAWFAVIATIGALGSRMFPDAAPDSVFFAVITEVLPAGVRGLVIAALVSIIASTQDSLLNSGAVAFTEDVANLTGKLTERSRLLVTVTTCVVAGIGATVFALFAPSIIDALLVVYTLWAPIMVVPLLFALLSTSGSPVAGIWGMVAGAVVTAIWHWAANDPMGLPPIVPGMLASLIATWVAASVGPRETISVLAPIAPRKTD